MSSIPIDALAQEWPVVLFMSRGHQLSPVRGISPVEHSTLLLQCGASQLKQRKQECFVFCGVFIFEGEFEMVLAYPFLYTSFMYWA